jgi:hypothetical protein
MYMAKSRESRDETAVLRTHQHQARQHHKKQLEQQGMPTKGGMPKQELKEG